MDDLNISVIFTGDFSPCGRFESIAMSERGSIFGDLVKNISASDLSFVNLESPLCSSGKPINKSGPNLKAHPDCINALVGAGFDIVGLANNHIMDYGQEGLEETLLNCKKKSISVCGASFNIKQAREAAVVERKGLKVAIVAVAEHEFSIAEVKKPGAAPLNHIDNSRQIKALRDEADLVFITIHGGNEYFPYPRPGLRQTCQFYVEQGADAVICHHAHVPGAYEFHQGKPIVYSLGNLLFDHPAPPDGWTRGYALRLEYSTETKKLIDHEIIPYTQSIDQGGVVMMQEKEREDFLEVLSGYGRTLADPEEYAKEWSTFCASKEAFVLLKMFVPFQFRGLGKLNKFFPITKLFLPQSSIAARKNLIQCESHRELILEILSKK